MREADTGGFTTEIAASEGQHSTQLCAGIGRRARMPPHVFRYADMYPCEAREGTKQRVDSLVIRTPAQDRQRRPGVILAFDQDGRALVSHRQGVRCLEEDRPEV